MKHMSTTGMSHWVPGVLFIGSLVVGMFALAQGRELAKKKPTMSIKPSDLEKKKTLEELVEEINRRYPAAHDYEMKETTK